MFPVPGFYLEICVSGGEANPTCFCVENFVYVYISQNFHDILSSEYGALTDDRNDSRQDCSRYPQLNIVGSTSTRSTSYIGESHSKVHQSGAVKQQQPIVQGNSTQSSAEALYQPVKSVFDNKGPISKGHSYSPIGQSYRVEANHNIFIAVQQLPLVVLHVGRSQITLDFNVLPVTLSAISVRKEETTK